jgi:AraC-like DNA-binding protein
MLFESAGTTFTEYVLEQRLTRAHHMLNSALHDWTIGAIAFEVGFSNLSYFNRAFRRRFGMTPSDARRAGREATGD